MTRILRIDASSRRDEANSRELANLFVSQWLAREPDAEIMRRDLAETPLPHIANETIRNRRSHAAEQNDGPAWAATALSDLLIPEMLDANVSPIATPM